MTYVPSPNEMGKESSDGFKRDTYSLVQQLPAKILKSFTDKTHIETPDHLGQRLFWYVEPVEVEITERKACLERLRQRQ